LAKHCPSVACGPSGQQRSLAEAQFCVSTLHGQLVPLQPLDWHTGSRAHAGSEHRPAQLGLPLQTPFMHVCPAAQSALLVHCGGLLLVQDPLTHV
jgi:hypothetical protein